MGLKVIKNSISCETCFTPVENNSIPLSCENCGLNFELYDFKHEINLNGTIQLKIYYARNKCDIFWVMFPGGTVYDSLSMTNEKLCEDIKNLTWEDFEKRILSYKIPPQSPESYIYINKKYELYDEKNLREEFEEHCNSYSHKRIFFEGPVKLINQKTFGAVYKLSNEPDCIIKVPNMSHIRLTDFPYPEVFNILAPVIDNRTWGKNKKIVKIINGLIPSSYIFLNDISYYLEKSKEFNY